MTAPRRAVVTGGARGIGAAIVTRLRADDYDVVALDVVGGPGVVSCDVSDQQQVRAAAAEVGPVDVLVNNAATWRFDAFEDVSLDDFDQVMAVNVRGPFNCIQAFGQSMLAQGRGSIVNLVSIAAQHANPAVGAYSPSKAALLAMTRQVAVEWGPRGVRCNAVGPGLIPTPGAGVYSDPVVSAQRAAAVPLRRLGEPEEIAEAVAFFASDRAAYISGQVVYLDGGLSQSLMTTLGRPAGFASPQAGEPARS